MNGAFLFKAATIKVSKITTVIFVHMKRHVLNTRHRYLGRHVVLSLYMKVSGLAGVRIG